MLTLLKDNSFDDFAVKLYFALASKFKGRGSTGSTCEFSNNISSCVKS